MYTYKITNTVNNKVYIGQTLKTNPRKRWWEHKKLLKSGKAHNKHLQASWNKYGQDAFIWEILAEVDTQQELDQLEVEYIKEYKSRDPKYGYNIKDGGQGEFPIYVLSEETRNRMFRSIKLSKKRSKSLKGKKHSQEHIDKVRKANANCIYPKVISSTGKIFQPTNLREFCKVHDLNTGSFRNMLQRRYRKHHGYNESYLGWRLLDPTNPYKPTRIPIKRKPLKDPNGKIHGICEMKILTKFCKQYKLSMSRVDELFTGKTQFHFGWTLA